MYLIDDLELGEAVGDAHGNVGPLVVAALAVQHVPHVATAALRLGVRLLAVRVTRAAASKQVKKEEGR